MSLPYLLIWDLRSVQIYVKLSAILGNCVLWWVIFIRFDISSVADTVGCLVKCYAKKHEICLLRLFDMTQLKSEGAIVVSKTPF